jgi:two-component system response regulator DevR
MVLDVRLPDGSGAQVCRDVRAVDPSITGLLLTSVGDEDALILSVLSGASGFVIKLAGTNEILDAVRRVGEGRPLLDPASVTRVRDDLAIRADGLQPPLTVRQADVLSLVLEGKTDQEVADSLLDQVPLVRDEVSLLMARLTTSPDRVDRPSPGRHRRDS